MNERKRNPKCIGKEMLFLKERVIPSKLLSRNIVSGFWPQKLLSQEIGDFSHVLKRNT